MKARFFIPIVTIILAVVMTILYFVNLKFIYYLLGGIIAIITHYLMLLQTNSMISTISTRVGRITFQPRKSSILWYVLRIIVAASLIAGICYFANIKDNPNKLQIVILLLSGYLTVKFSFIIYLLKFERG
ncbi:MAG: hypothetical protein IKP77_02120 [Acholeplasmatales bacterium]|nr:hypothetical protein [Acholeplasmatales bacterium]